MGWTDRYLLLKLRRRSRLPLKSGTRGNDEGGDRAQDEGGFPVRACNLPFHRETPFIDDEDRQEAYA